MKLGQVFVLLERACQVSEWDGIGLFPNAFFPVAKTTKMEGFQRLSKCCRMNDSVCFRFLLAENETKTIEPLEDDK